jgi:predicted GNAT superfamily acetyltransferase
MSSEWYIKILDTPAEMEAVEALQRQVWPGSETDVVPLHLLVTASHNGGLVIGAYQPESGGPDRLVGFVFGFAGLYFTPDGPRPKHCSHMLGVDPQLRDQGLGFALKRAQWQMVRHQGLDRITWTYDPLLSRNAYLNIAKLGAVCNLYHREVYGDMRDGLNQGLPSDRFEVDWWVNSQRVERRLSRKARLRLDLAHFLAAGAEIVNPSTGNGQIWPTPGPVPELPDGEETSLLLVEIPADFQGLKTADRDLAGAWREHTRALFEGLFASGFLVTDFIFLPGRHSRSYYVLSHGESTF